MGIAILSGILSSLSEHGAVTPAADPPAKLPSRFIACVQRPASVKRIHTSLASYQSSLTVLQQDNLRGVREGDVILLCCKPQLVATVLGNSDSDVSTSDKASPSPVLAALRGKILISICAGVSVSMIEEILYGPISKRDPDEGNRCRIVRAMPNTASSIRESMTVISTPTPALPPDVAALTTWIFSHIGRVIYLPPSTMDASTALCGSGPAFFALVLEAIADGAVAMGLPRAEAQLMAAQTMRGTAGLVLAGEHPALVREKVGTPGGCTIGGLLVLEEGRVRGTVARAVREATVVASQLGKGVKGVNGTRP